MKSLLLLIILLKFLKKINFTKFILIIQYFSKIIITFFQKI